ncbi:MAG: hypothetical protein HC883_05865, partial [Bdellovibrionaceae bacterium]|nr:hypothetical protein [Pseudobdellovibrionaceae bacterium]
KKHEPEVILPVTLAEAKAVVNKWLYFQNDEIIDVVIAGIVSNQYPGDPLWVVIVGPPSSGKTEILRGADGHPSVYFIGGITDHTLISGLPKVQGTLEKMNGKEIVFIVKDLGGLLSMRAEARLEVFQQLREAYDGRLDKEFGSGKKVSWRGKLGFIAGATPAIEEHHNLIGNLGERHLYYREIPGDRKKGIKKAFSSQGQEVQMRHEIRTAITGVIERMKGFDFDTISIADDVMEWIQNLSIITTILRTPVSRDGYKKDVVIFDPVPEGPFRMGKSLNLLSRVLAAIRDHKEVMPEDYAVVVKVAADSLPSIRRRILGIMCKEYLPSSAYVKARDVALQSGLSSEYCGFILEDLTLLGVVDRQVDRSETTGYYFQKSPYIYKLRGEIYKQIDECGLMDMIVPSGTAGGQNGRDGEGVV